MWSVDDEFFLSVVNEFLTANVLDLGCGTGRLTIALAAAGHRVVGVDPAIASLRVARAKPGAENVDFIHGTSADLPDMPFDVAVMTSHVAQFFLTDQQWRTTLADVHRALVPGGVLVFDARDPEARGWERWNPTESFRQVRLPGGQIVDVWTEVTDIAEEIISFRRHYVFAERPELFSTASLRFRSEHEIRLSLESCGFVIDHIFGGWRRQKIGEGDGEFIVVAHRGQ